MNTPNANSPKAPKGPHGGSRTGAGRKPNSHANTWHWMQIGAMLTHNEHTLIKHPYLTPAQRRHRLLSPPGDAVEHSNNVEDKNLMFACVRVAYTNLIERAAILALPMPERRRRLLTIPPGGDLVDRRPGRWDKNKP